MILIYIYIYIHCIIIIIITLFVSLEKSTRIQHSAGDIYVLLANGGNSNIFYLHPDPWGFMIQFDEHIFQMGWWKTTN